MRASAPALVRAEDQHLLPTGLLQEVDQQGGLLLGPHRIRDLRNALRHGARRRDFDPGRVLRHAQSEVVDAVGHGGREEQRLGPGAQPPGDFLDLGAEAHVQHSVGFVQDEDADALELGLPPLLQVDQPARCRHDDLVAPGQRVQLRLVADPAADHGGPQAGPPREGHRVFLHLVGQLPRGAERQRLQPLACAHHVQRREHERSGLPGAGPGNAHQVPSLQHQGDRLPLNRGRLAPAQGVDGGQPQLGKPEGGKHVGIGHFQT